jgi:hypothetical protein
LVSRADAPDGPSQFEEIERGHTQFMMNMIGEFDSGGLAGRLEIISDRVSQSLHGKLRKLGLEI